MNVGILHHSWPTLGRVRQRLAALDAEVWLATTSPQTELQPLKPKEHYVPVACDQYSPLLFLKNLLLSLDKSQGPLLLIEADVLLEKPELSQISQFKTNCFFLYKELHPFATAAYGRKRTMSMFLTNETVQVLAGVLAEVDDTLLAIPLHCEPSFITAILGLAPCTVLRLTHMTHSGRALPTHGLMARLHHDPSEPLERQSQRSLMQSLATHLSPDLCRGFFGRLLARLHPDSRGAAIFGVNATTMLLADLIVEEPLIRFVIDPHYPTLSKHFGTKPVILPEDVPARLHDLDTVIAITEASGETDILAYCLKVLPRHLRLVPLRYENWPAEREGMLLELLVRQALHEHGYFARVFSVLIELSGGAEEFRARFAAILDPGDANRYSEIGPEALRHWNHV